MNIVLKNELRGTILDIGGGGEGVIGQVYNQQVISIDNRQEELDEAPSNCKKILMDATCLDFQAEYFEHITFFYSLMYMDKAVQKKAICEAIRVLCMGGDIHIWDAKINSAYPEPFIVNLDINAAGKQIHTSYGIIKENASQNADTFIGLCLEYGLKLSNNHTGDGHFYLRFKK